MKVARASSGSAATERSRGWGWRLVELIGHLRYFAAGRPARKTLRTLRTAFRSFNGWEGRVWPASQRMSTWRLLGDATPSQPPLPRPAPPRLPPALGLPVRVAHGEPDAGGGPQLAHLRADRLPAR